MMSDDTTMLFDTKAHSNLMDETLDYAAEETARHSTNQRRLSLSQSHGTYHGSMPAVEDQLSSLEIGDKPEESPMNESFEKDEGSKRALVAERDRLRAINTLLEKTIDNVSTMQGQFDRFKSITATTHHLVDVYSRILTQQQHNSALLLNGEYDMDKDQAEVEQNERDARDRLENEKRKAEDQKRAESERERKAQQSETTGVPSTRGSTRGIARGRILSRGKPVPESGGVYSAGRGSAEVSGVRGVRGIRSRTASRPPTQTGTG